MLEVTSDPAGCSIWVNGDLRQEVTPATIENLPLGSDLQIKLTKEGLESFRETVQPMNTGGTWKFDWGSVKWIRADHSSSFPDGTYAGSPNGILLRAEGKIVYNTCDTAPFVEMQWIGNDYDVDVCLMPIGDCYTQGPEDAVRSARMIRPALTIPLHYDTFPLIEVDVSYWERLMDEAGFRTRVLGPTESMEI